LLIVLPPAKVPHALVELPPGYRSVPPEYRRIAYGEMKRTGRDANESITGIETGNGAKVEPGMKEGVAEKPPFGNAKKKDLTPA
jgi:hypothetical protein